MESGKLKWWHVRWKRLGLALVIVWGTLFLIAFVGRLIAYELYPWLMARWMAQHEPYVAIVPEPVGSGLAPLPGKRVECFGLSFDFPWTTVNFERKNNHGCSLSSDSDGSVFFFNSAEPFDTARMNRSIASSWSLADLKWSNYDLWRAAMGTTPSNVKWWRTRQQNARSFDLLLLKSGTMLENRALYVVNFGEMRGFQAGDPSTRPYKVQLDLFDRNDLHYMIRIESIDEKHPVISQAEINALIASMKPIPYPAQTRP